MLKKLLIAAACLLGLVIPCPAQPVGPGPIPSPFILNGSTIYYPGLLQIPGSTSAGAHLNFVAGIVPASPNNGDMWMATAGLFIEVNGQAIGPLAGASS